MTLLLTSLVPPRWRGDKCQLSVLANVKSWVIFFLLQVLQISVILKCVALKFVVLLVRLSFVSFGKIGRYWKSNTLLCWNETHKKRANTQQVANEYCDATTLYHHQQIRHLPFFIVRVVLRRIWIGVSVGWVWMSISFLLSNADLLICPWANFNRTCLEIWSCDLQPPKTWGE